MKNKTFRRLIAGILCASMVLTGSLSVNAATPENLHSQSETTESKDISGTNSNVQGGSSSTGSSTEKTSENSMSTGSSTTTSSSIGDSSTNSSSTATSESSSSGTGNSTTNTTTVETTETTTETTTKTAKANDYDAMSIDADDYVISVDESEFCTAVQVDDSFFDTYHVDDTQSVEDVYFSSGIDNTPKNYFYYNMSASERNLYDALNTICHKYMTTTTNTGTCLYKGTNYGLLESVSYSSMSSTTAFHIARIFRLENPQYYFLSALMYYTSNGSDDKIALTSYSEFINGATRKVYSEKVDSQFDIWKLDFESKSTAYEKEKTIHDMINDTTEYDYGRNTYDQSCVSVMTDIAGHKTVCAGYAATFQLLASLEGFDSVVVTSNTHAWNICKVYGKWYYVDCTWDDCGYGYTYFDISGSTLNKKDQNSAHIIESFWTDPPECLDDYDSDSKISYNVTYHLNGGSCPAGCTYPASFTENEISSGTIPVSSPVYAGNVFKGWYIDEACTTKFSFSPRTTNQIDLYAKWQIAVNSITITNSEDSIYPGDVVKLRVSVTPNTAQDKSVTWSIVFGSDCASVTGDKLSAKNKGSVKVRAEANDGSGIYAEKQFNILPKGISITAADNATKLTSGKTLKLSAVKTPQRNTESGVTWSVDNTSVAKISSGGVLTALNVAEKTTIRVTAKDDAHSYPAASYEVAIIPKASKVVLSKGGTVVTGQTLGLNVDGTLDLTAAITPSDAAQDVTWKSGSSSIASVENGHVTGLNAGKTDITATSADGTRVTGKVTISVCRMVTEIQINGNDAMTAGQKMKLSVTCAPDSATNKAVTWTCDDPSRAVVDRNGTVSAVKTAKAGSFNITATAADGSGVTATKKITITQKAETLKLYDNNDNNDPRLISNGQKIGYDYDAKELNNKHPEVKLRVEALADDKMSGVSQTFTWKSSAPAVAEVDSESSNDIYIDVFKTGTTVISATTTDGSNLTTSCTICVKSQITDITITGQDEISVKKSTVLTAVVSPDSAAAADKKVKWTSSDPAVASVTSAAAQTMTVTGRSAGTATITATAADGAGIYDTGDNAGKNIFGTFTVTVKAGIPDKVMIWNLTKDQEAAKVETLDSYLYKGEPNANFRIDAYVLDKQGGDDVCQDVVWSSSNTAVADVIERDKGDEKRYYVTAAAPGRTTITATTVDGSKKSASITVNVTQSKVQIHGEYEIAVGKSVKLKAYGPGVTWSIAKYDGAEPTAQVLKAIKVSNGTVSVNAKAESIIGADVSGKEITVRATSKLKGDSDNNDDYILTIKDQTQKMVIIDNSDNSDVTGKTVGFERNDLGTEQKMSFMAESRGSSNTTEGISQNITWKISDTRKASLETYYDNAKKTTICIVEPLQAGNVKLTATSTDGTNKSASVTINIAKLVQRLSVGGQTNEVAAGRSIQLTATVLPTNAVNKKVTWNATYTTPDSSTLAKNDITISSSGVIKTKSSVPCKTVIHAAATAMDGSGLTTTYDVTVTKPADNIFILRNDGKAADVYGIDRDLIGSGPWVGFKAEVNGDVGTTEGVSQSVDWKNGNPSVVQVYSYAGILYIRPLKVGKAVITFIAEDGTNTKASMTINVASLATGVEISGDDTNVKQGKSIQLTAKVTPTYAENKKVNWSINILDAQGNPLSAKLATVRNGKVTTNRKIPVGAEITVWADTLDGSLLTSVPYIINVD